MHRPSTVNVQKHCIITCCYLFLMFFLLLLLRQLYNIGKYEGFGWISTLALMELVKWFYASNKLQRIRVRNVLLGGSVICASVVAFFVVTVLLGAEVFGQFEGTLMFALLLSTLTTLPVCLNLGGRFITDFVKHRSYEETTLSQNLIQNACATFLGSWLGAFVIPLDWDRDWQVWPIPCSLGALAGYFLSNFITAIGFVSFFVQKQTVSKYKL